MAIRYGIIDMANRRVLLVKILLFLFFLMFSSPVWAINYCTNGDLGGGWKFDAASGTEPDCTSNANTATGTSVTEGVTGKYNLAVSFPGSNGSYVLVTAATSINTLPTPVMGAWINPTTAGQGGNVCTGATIIGKTQGGGGPELCINANGSISFFAKWTGGGVKWTTTTTPVTYTGTWQHVAVVYSFSSTSNVPVVYYNGISQAVTTSGSPFGSQSSDSSDNLDIGNEASGGVGGGFNGTIDEPFYGSWAATSTDMNNLMVHGLDGTENNSSTNHGFTRFLK